MIILGYMAFKGKPGTCIDCKQIKMIVCKGKCKECYMKSWNDRKDIKEMKKDYEERRKWKNKLRPSQELIQSLTDEFVTLTFLKEIFIRDKNTCQYCGAKRNLIINYKKTDIKEPNNQGNLILSCISCNALNLKNKEHGDR